MRNFGRTKQALTVICSVAALLLALGAPVLACINVYGTTLEGKTIETDRHEHMENPLAVKARWREKLKEIEASIKPDSRFEIRNDYAAALIYTGNYKKAIEILEDIEKTNPGVYSTATNLGTAYELSGDNEKALEWIKKGIDRNPSSHDGSEWVHVKILEAKIQLTDDPQWLKKNSVLGFHFGSEIKPQFPAPVQGYPDKSYDSKQALYHVRRQLEERLQFVSAPDPIVADLFADLANAYALHHTLEMAVPLYDRALEFKYDRTLQLKQRRDALAEIMKASQPISASREYWIAGSLIAGLVVAFLVLRKIRQVF
jgi:tetratricopeptide (TPR) repeat protein